MRSRVDRAAEQVHVLGVLAARRARQLHDERITLSLDQTRERILYGAVVGEGMQTSASCSELPGCLRAAQQQQTDDRELRLVEL